MFRTILGLTDNQRQNVTTFSMMGGIIALTGCIAGMVLFLRYWLPEQIVMANGALYVGGLFNIIYGFMGLMGIQIIAQAVIAVGGRLKAALGPASFEAEAETKRDLE